MARWETIGGATKETLDELWMDKLLATYFIIFAEHILIITTFLRVHREQNSGSDIFCLKHHQKISSKSKKLDPLSIVTRANITLIWAKPLVCHTWAHETMAAPSSNQNQNESCKNKV